MRFKLLRDITLCASLITSPIESQAIPIKAETPLESPLKTSQSRKSLDGVMYDYHQDMKAKVEAMVKKAFYQGGFFDHEGYCDHVKMPEGYSLPILADVSNGTSSFPAFEFGENRRSDQWDQRLYESQVRLEIEDAILNDLPKGLPSIRDGYIIQPRNSEIVAKVRFNKSDVSVHLETDLIVWDAANEEVYSLMDKEIYIGLPAGRILEELDARMVKFSGKSTIPQVSGSRPKTRRDIIKDGGLVLQYLIKVR